MAKEEKMDGFELNELERPLRKMMYGEDQDMSAKAFDIYGMLHPEIWESYNTPRETAYPIGWALILRTELQDVMARDPDLAYRCLVPKLYQLRKALLEMPAADYSVKDYFAEILFRRSDDKIKEHFVKMKTIEALGGLTRDFKMFEMIAQFRNLDTSVIQNYQDKIDEVDRLLITILRLEPDLDIKWHALLTLKLRYTAEDWNKMYPDLLPPSPDDGMAIALPETTTELSGEVHHEEGTVL